MMAVDHDTLHELLQPSSASHMQSLTPQGFHPAEIRPRFWRREEAVHSCWAENHQPGQMISYRNLIYIIRKPIPMLVGP